MNTVGLVYRFDDDFSYEELKKLLDIIVIELIVLCYNTYIKYN